MISLSLQIKLIVYSFSFGFLFSSLLDWFNKKIYKFNQILKFIYSFALLLILTILYFIGLNKIGNAIFHIYSILMIIIGFISYDIIIRIIEYINKPPRIMNFNISYSSCWNFNIINIVIHQWIYSSISTGERCPIIVP